MAIPEQIRKQTEAVKELYKDIYADSEQGDTPDDSNKSGDTDTNATKAYENTGRDNAPQSSSNEQQLGEPGNGEGQPKEDYVQKYKTLQGMYNAEVPKLHTQNRDLQSRVQQMEQLLATLSAQSNTEQQPAGEVKPFITDQDREEYGESIDVMRRVSREEAAPVLQKMSQIEGLLRQLQTNVVPQVQNLTQKQAMSSEQQFWSGLTEVTPNWRDVNNNPDFQSWLLESDPFTGVTRQTILEDAQHNLDVYRVGSFFNTWLGMNGQASTAQSSQRSTSASELERQVSPGKSRSGGTPSSGNAKVYSPDDIKKFFEDVRKGKYKGKEADRDRIERDIFAAQRDNRIVNNA